MRCVLETFPDHTVYHLLGFSCMFSTQEDALEPGDLGHMGWVPCSITLKGMRWLTQPQQTSQPQECPPLCVNQLWVQIWSIQVASQPLNELCKNFSFFHCLCFTGFEKSFIFIMGFSCFSRLCLCRFTPPWLTYREISIHRFEDSYQSDIFLCGEQGC